jgi:hypothetical protein
MGGTTIVLTQIGSSAGHRLALAIVDDPASGSSSGGLALLTTALPRFLQPSDGHTLV